MKVLLAIAVLLGTRSIVAAHPLDMGYLRVEGGTGEVAVTFDIDVTVAEGILHVERLDATTVAARAVDLAAATYRSAAPAIDGAACTWTTATAQIKGRSVSLSERARCPSGTTFRWELPFVKRMSATFQVLAKVRAFDVERVVVLEKNQLAIELTGDASTTGFAGSVWQGIEHVGLAPGAWHGDRWPLDHILFAIALVLAGGALVRMLVLTGLVAVAHALGTALAVTGVEVPAAVFPVTIGVVAICAIDPRLEKVRWGVALLAGTLHGLAVGLDLDGARPLVGFDLGFALALIAVVIAVGPLATIAHREEQGRWVLRGAAVAICAASLYWFVRSF